MNMKRFLSIFFVLPLVFVSCDLTMDEVSQDVNKPTQVHPKTILTQLCITTFGIEYYGVQPYRLAWQWDQRGGGGHHQCALGEGAGLGLGHGFSPAF